MVSERDLPPLIREEYDYFKKNRVCKKADELNGIFGHRLCLIPDYPPCFFAGDISGPKRRLCLFSLNPGYNEKSNTIELNELKEKNKFDWYRTYVTFFEWFYKEGASSPYYKQIAKFLSKLLGNRDLPEGREQEGKLLSDNLINIDLIPYHSRRTSFRIDPEKREQMEVITPYLETVSALAHLCRPKALLINGASFKPLLRKMGFSEQIRKSFPINKKLRVYVDRCFGIKAVWFDKFISSAYAGCSDEQLSDASRWIREKLKL